MYSVFKKEIRSRLLRRLTENDYNFEVKDDDRFIVSYPKSGNTWMLFLIANLLSNKEIYFDNIEDYIIDIYQADVEQIKNYRNSRDKLFFKSHSYFRPKYSPNKVLYIIRDPRDVVLSYYHWYYYRKEKLELERFITKFLNGDLDEFGNWKQHIGSWIGARKGDNSFLVIKYEDMLENTFKELEKVSTFFGINASKEALEKAVSASDFNKLQKKQMDKSETEKDKLFFRKGTSKQWEEELSIVQLEKIKKQFGIMMSELGYN